MRLFYQPGVPEGIHYLDTEESRHCIKVLRKKQHDHINIVDGLGTFYKAIITGTDPRQTQFQIVEQNVETPRNYYIHLAVAPTKRLERMEWLVEKATELGIDRISFVMCQNSERAKLRLDRLQRKAISAMKQSLKASLPILDDLVAYKDFISMLTPETSKFLAHLGDTAEPFHKVAPPGASYCVLIGPEGDFSPQEIAQAIKLGFQTVQLGNSRLRTETAALVAVIALSMVNS